MGKGNDVTVIFEGTAAQVMRYLVEHPKLVNFYLRPKPEEGEQQDVFTDLAGQRIADALGVTYNGNEFLEGYGYFFTDPATCSTFCADSFGDAIKRLGEIASSFRKGGDGI